MKLRYRISVNKQYEIYKLLDWIDIDKLNWYFLSQNPNAIYLLEQNQDKLILTSLEVNSNAINLLQQNQDIICWNLLSSNENAIHLLKQNQDKINWNWISLNKNAIHLLEQNQDKINWTYFSQNTSIFTYNYKEIKRRMKETIAEDLMKNRFHPKYIDKWIEWGQVEPNDFL